MNCRQTPPPRHNRAAFEDRRGAILVASRQRVIGRGKIVVAFANLETLPADASGFLSNVADMRILSASSGPMLYLATDRGGGLSAYHIGTDGMLTLTGTVAYASQSSSLASTELTTVPILGKEALLPIGSYDQQLTAYGLNSDGTLTGNKAGVLSAPSALPTETAHAVAVMQGGTGYVYTAHSGAAAPVGHEIVGNTTLQPVAGATGSGTADGTITAMGAVDSGSAHLLVAGFTGDDRLTSYTIDAAGGLTAHATLGAPEGLSITTPTAIASAEVDGHSYAVVASAGSSTLSVVELGPDGSMVATDQVVDDLNTRFAHADLVTTVAQGGHDFVLAAGSDDGMSLFALLPGGRLEHLSTVADQTDTTLAHASAISAVAQGSALDVYAASASEPGLTGYKVDLSHFGSILEGSASGGTVTGTAQDDILVSHGGADHLVGGAGADLFVFDAAGAAADGQLGTVADFTPGVDKLDLSDLPMLYDVGRLTIDSTATGAELHYGNYWLAVDSAAGTPLSASDFNTANILNASHQPVGLSGSDPYVTNTQGSTPAGVIYDGTSGNDNITGDLGNDSLGGGLGNDTIAGLDGNDTIHGGDGVDSISGGLGDDLIYGGASSADGGDHIDAGAGNNTVDGGWGNDSITAGAGHDLLVGGAGNDWIDAGDGNNTIRGGDGQDTLIGGAGADSILGGDTRADLHDAIYGGAGNDTIDAGFGNDSVSGGAGQDSIDGNFGADTLIGNDGNDTLSGGPGSDLMFGGPGDDFLNGGFGNNRLNGGAGADKFYHLSAAASQGADWIQDYKAADGDVLVYGDSAANASQFQLNYAETAGAGQAGVNEAFVVYKPTGQIVWALVDGAAQSHIELQIAGHAALHDLMA
jgi:Ca2+-binding RTX toxin-like protein